jgi:hypothetical protein
LGVTWIPAFHCGTTFTSHHRFTLTFSKMRIETTRFKVPKCALLHVHIPVSNLLTLIGDTRVLITLVFTAQERRPSCYLLGLRRRTNSPRSADFLFIEFRYINPRVEWDNRFASLLPANDAMTSNASFCN